MNAIARTAQRANRGPARSGWAVPLASLAAGLFLAGLSPVGAQAPTAPPPPLVAVAPVVRQSGTAAEQSFVGSVMPARHSIIGSAVGGRVVEFLVKEGDRVAKKQPLARLLTRALEIQRDAALAELDLRQQELNELEAGARPEELEQARAHMDAVQALADYSQSKFERTKALIERRAASADQLQDDAAAAKRNQQAFLEAKAAYDLVAAGPRKEKKAQARARVNSAQEEVNRLEDQLEKHTIYAPFDGFVTKEHTEVGQWISSGEPVADVVELDEVDVEAMVLESYVSHVTVGTKAKVRIDALPDREFEGTVSHIVPQADIRSRSFPVKVALANEFLRDGTPLLKPGMFARVTLPVAGNHRRLMVPKDALVPGPQPIVFVVDRDRKDPRQGMARPVAVKLGTAHDDHIEVVGKLTAGQEVVVEGNERLRPTGQPVTLPAVKPSASAKGRAPAQQAARQE